MITTRFSMGELTYLAALRTTTSPDTRDADLGWHRHPDSARWADDVRQCAGCDIYSHRHDGWWYVRHGEALAKVRVSEWRGAFGPWLAALHESQPAVLA